MPTLNHDYTCPPIGPLALAQVRQGQRQPRHQSEDVLSADARQLGRRRILGPTKADFAEVAPLIDKGSWPE